MLGEVGDQFYTSLFFNIQIKYLYILLVIVGCSIWYDMRLLSLFQNGNELLISSRKLS